MARFCSETGKLHSMDKQFCENCGANLKVPVDIIDLDISPLPLRTKPLPASQTVAGSAIQAANFRVQAKAARPNAGSTAISSRPIGSSSKTIYRAILYILHQKWYYSSRGNQLEDEKEVLPIIAKCDGFLVHIPSVTFSTIDEFIRNTLIPLIPKRHTSLVQHPEQLELRTGPVIKNKDRDIIISHELGFLPGSVVNFDQLSKMLIEDHHTTTSGGTGFQIHLLAFVEDVKATSSALANEVSPGTSYHTPTPTAKSKKRQTKKVKVENIKTEEDKTEEDENIKSETPIKSKFTLRFSKKGKKVQDVEEFEDMDEFTPFTNDRLTRSTL